MKKSIKKKIIIGVSIVLGILLVAGIGASYYFGKMVTEGLFYQNKGNDTKKNSLLQLEEWGMIWRNSTRNILERRFN